MNLSQQKREQMLAFLGELKKQHSDDASVIALNQIEQALNEKRYGLVWEEHSENVEEMLKTHIPVFQEVLDKKLEPVTPPHVQILTKILIS